MAEGKRMLTESSVRNAVQYTFYAEPEADRLFDAWLAERDRKVAAQALRDAAEAWAEDPDSVDSETPADTRNWMRDRADEVEASS